MRLKEHQLRSALIIVIFHIFDSPSTLSIPERCKKHLSFFLELNIIIMNLLWIPLEKMEMNGINCKFTLLVIVAYDVM